MAVLLKSHVIVLVTTGRFTEAVLEHAKGVAEGTPLQVLLIDGRVLDVYRKAGVSGLLEHFRQGAREVLRLKRDQVTSESSQ